MSPLRLTLRISVSLPLILAMSIASGSAHAQPYMGSDDLEPDLAGRDDILLFEDFELGDWAAHWTEVPDSTFQEAVTTQVFQGSRSLHVTAPEGEHYGTSMEWAFGDAGLDEPEEIYFRYYIYIDTSYSLANGGTIGKMPGFGGCYGVAGWGGRPSDGYNGWSARMKIWDYGDEVQLGFDPYHVDTEETTGENMPWPGLLPRNQWLCIETHVLMNTIGGDEGNNDGELHGWVDDELVFERTDMRFRHIDDLKIEMIWFDVYVGGDFTAEHDMHLFFDNIVIARDRIGCLGTYIPPTQHDAGTEDGQDGGTVADGNGGGCDCGFAGEPCKSAGTLLLLIFLVGLCLVRLRR